MTTQYNPAASNPIKLALLIHISKKNENADDLPEKTGKYISYTINITNNKIKTEEIYSQQEKRDTSSTIMGALNKASHRGCTHAFILREKNENLLENFSVLLENIEKHPSAFWIGNRNVPKKDSGNTCRQMSIKNKMTNLWYRLLTGIRLHDTLCPIRVYPIHATLHLQCKGEQCSWEQSVLVTAAWHGMPVHEFALLEPPGAKGYFTRQTKDFLCTLRVFTGLTVKKIVLPAEILTLPGAGWRQQIVSLVKHEMRANTTPNKAAGSVALGVCMGLSPFHGFQTALLLAMSYLFHLNRPLAILGVNVSCAPLIPFIIAAEIAVGKLIVPTDLALASLDGSMAKLFTQGFAAFLVGSSILSIAGGIMTFLLTKPLFSHLIQSRMKNKKVNKI
jgi:uncharacterized protein (DUF2062 family)